MRHEQGVPFLLTGELSTGVDSGNFSCQQNGFLTSLMVFQRGIDDFRIDGIFSNFSYCSLYS